MRQGGKGGSQSGYQLGVSKGSALARNIVWGAVRNACRDNQFWARGPIYTCKQYGGVFRCVPSSFLAGARRSQRQ